MTTTNETEAAGALVAIAAALAGGWLALSTCPPETRRALMEDAMTLFRLAGQVLDEAKRAGYSSAPLPKTEGVPC